LVNILEPSADEAPYHLPPDEDYTQISTLQPISSRNHLTRKRNPSQKVINNLIPIDELPLESEEVYVNNVFATFLTVPTSYSNALRRPDAPKWVKAMEKQLESLRKAGT
jgi:type IV secretory pathway ATPase VirB11/archaellum biosynthesis ATPase